MSTARYYLGGTGTGSLALAATGITSTQVTNTEEWSFPSGPHLNEGDIFLSGAGTTLKGFGRAAGIPAGTWASGGAMGNARDNTTGTGHTQDAALVMGGRGPSSNIGNCEKYDGTSWTEVATITARRLASGSGTSTDALCFGGTTSYPSATPGQSDLTEKFNGTSWTEVAELNTARWRASGSPAGSSTAALCTGGREPGYSAKTEQYNGTSWTELADLNASKAGAGAAGTSIANIFSGGETAPGADTANCESWNGTAWTEVNNLPAAAKENGGAAGTSTAAFVAGVGGGAVPTSECDFWNGTSWAEMAELTTGRPQGGGAGTSVTAAIFGGNPFTTATEEFTADATLSTVTVS